MTATMREWVLMISWTWFGTNTSRTTHLPLFRSLLHLVWLGFWRDVVLSRKEVKMNADDIKGYEMRYEDGRVISFHGIERMKYAKPLEFEQEVVNPNGLGIKYARRFIAIPSKPLKVFYRVTQVVEDGKWLASYGYSTSHWAYQLHGIHLACYRRKEDAIKACNDHWNCIVRSLVRHDI